MNYFVAYRTNYHRTADRQLHYDDTLHIYPVSRYQQHYRRIHFHPKYFVHVRDQRWHNDEERAAKLSIERPMRDLCGITRYEEWPSYAWPGGYDLIYYVADDTESARRSSVDGTLCADCLNKDFSHNVVVAVESSDSCDDPLHCDHCCKNIGSSFIQCVLCEIWEDYDTSAYSEDHDGYVCIHCSTFDKLLHPKKG